MINYDALTLRLRGMCPFFKSEIYGAAEFEDELAALEQGKAASKVPAAYVATLGIEPEENVLANSVQQRVTEAFIVTVFLNNRMDRDGRTAASNLPTVMAQLNAAVLNWNPLPERTRHAITLVEAKPVITNRAIAVHQFQYELKWYLTEEDGYQEPSDAFVEIDITDPEHSSLGTIRVDLPQV